MTLTGGRTALALLAPPDVSGEDAVNALALPQPTGVMVVNGGTAHLEADTIAHLRRQLGELAALARDERVALVTGGTDAGVFALLGQALGVADGVTCIGVAPADLVAWRDRHSSELAALEPHHTHFLLVEGRHWGAETAAMMALTAALAHGRPSVAVVAGGGPVTENEVRAHVRAGRDVIVLAGTGRLADELAREAAPTVVVADAGADLDELVRRRLGLPRDGRS